MQTKVLFSFINSLPLMWSGIWGEFSCMILKKNEKTQVLGRNNQWPLPLSNISSSKTWAPLLFSWPLKTGDALNSPEEHLSRSDKTQIPMHRFGLIELESLRDESLEFGIWKIPSPSSKPMPGTVVSTVLVAASVKQEMSTRWACSPWLTLAYICIASQIRHTLK